MKSEEILALKKKAALLREGWGGEHRARARAGLLVTESHVQTTASKTVVALSPNHREMGSAYNLRGLGIRSFPG